MFCCVKHDTSKFGDRKQLGVVADLMIMSNCIE